MEGRPRSAMVRPMRLAADSVARRWESSTLAPMVKEPKPLSATRGTEAGVIGNGRRISGRRGANEPEPPFSVSWFNRRTGVEVQITAVQPTVR